MKTGIVNLPFSNCRDFIWLKESMLTVQKLQVMRGIPESPIERLKVHIAILKEMAVGQSTLGNCDRKHLIIHWKARLKFRELLRSWGNKWTETS